MKDEGTMRVKENMKVTTSMRNKDERAAQRLTKGIPLNKWVKVLAAWFFSFVTCCLLLPLSTALAAPQPLTLTLPQGQSMVLQPIVVGQGDSPYTQKIFTIGDASEEFRGSATRVSIGGSFFDESAGQGSQNSQTEWYYYLGQSEVTEGQYYAVMGVPKDKDATILQSRFPITNISYIGD